MTPFTVNLALTDSESLDLSHIIHPRVQEKSDWSAALRQSEAKVLRKCLHVPIWKLIVTLKDYELSVPPYN